MTEPTPRRAYEIWSDPENAQLIKWIRDGLPLEDIADRLGRGVDAVARHCTQMLPPEVRVKRADAHLFLRTHLTADPGYDWRAALRVRAVDTGSFYWDQDLDEIVRTGWDQAKPMAELVTATGASEIEVARRVLQLQLAETITEVAERLGCDPTGTLAVRINLAADRAASAVWVLIVDGARASERATPLDKDTNTKTYRHVSVHASHEDADQALTRLLALHADKDGTPEEVTVTWAERTVGELAVGTTHHQSAPTLTNQPQQHPTEPSQTPAIEHTLDNNE